MFARCVRAMRRPEMEPWAKLNNGYPFDVVRCVGGALGIVDMRRSNARTTAAGRLAHVWTGHALVAEETAWTSKIALPEIPAHYGRWVRTSIGGVGETTRREGILSADLKWRGSVTVFATHCPAGAALAGALDAWGIGYELGAAEETEAYGRVVEVCVYDAAELARACALIARCGATPVLEDRAVDARRPPGVERLDRIDAHVVAEDGAEEEEEDAYGVRRGRENWRFAWMPDTWARVPITWDHLVENVLHEDVRRLSYPLRQHVARRQKELGLFPWGLEWEPDGPCAAMCASRVLHAPELAARLGTGVTTCTVAERDAWGLGCVDSIYYLVQASDGRWFRPVKADRHYAASVKKKRKVSTALTAAQSEQLVTAFYLLNVEGVHDPVVREALHLIMFRYMIERGYTARRMGRYKQEALFVGNGDRYRHFETLTQYEPDRLPVSVLNKRCGRDGRMRNRGSKGTRSKYKSNNRYTPVQRIPRTQEDERSMAA